MEAVVLSCLLSCGVGLIAGGYYSIVGWIVAATLFFISVAITALTIGAGPLAALGWAVLVVIAFNAGLAVGLAIRATARPQPGRRDVPKSLNLHKNVSDR